MWYILVIDRLKHIFFNPRDAKLMQWHAKKHKKDGMLWHPTDASKWKNFDV